VTYRIDDIGYHKREKNNSLARGERTNSIVVGMASVMSINFASLYHRRKGGTENESFMEVKNTKLLFFNRLAFDSLKCAVSHFTNTVGKLKCRVHVFLRKL